MKIFYYFFFKIIFFSLIIFWKINSRYQLLLWYIFSIISVIFLFMLSYKFYIYYSLYIISFVLTFGFIILYILDGLELKYFNKIFDNINLYKKEICIIVNLSVMIIFFKIFYYYYSLYYVQNSILYEKLIGIIVNTKIYHYLDIFFSICRNIILSLIIFLILLLIRGSLPRYKVVDMQFFY